MTLRGSAPTRLLYLLLSVAFLGATGGEAFGLRHCPYHDRLSGPGAEVGETTSHAFTETVADRPEEAKPGAVQVPSHSEGPCTCLQDCHVGSTTVGPASDPGRLAALPGVPVRPASLEDHGAVRGPRHDLFELHLPNAPPVPS